jgi:hypothetical protein
VCRQDRVPILSVCSTSLTYQSENDTKFWCYNVDLPFELVGKFANDRIISFERLVIYASFIAVLFLRPWRRIWSSFTPIIPVVRADEPRLICVDTSWREDLADRFPTRRVSPFQCMVGWFYLSFKLSPSYFRNSSQCLNAWAAIFECWLLIMLLVWQTKLVFLQKLDDLWVIGCMMSCVVGQRRASIQSGIDPLL